jgi:medium-chain acyl-[acyl-carrier-protein] hydrolase
MLGQAESNRWITRASRKSHARLRLFCFPYAGGGASFFRFWSSLLPDLVEVCPVNLPGRELRIKETAFAELSGLVTACAEALAPYFDKPFVFFGHSMGALVSFELARHLRREGGPQPLQLLVAGRRAPQRPRTTRPLHELPDKLFTQALRQLNGTPDKVLNSTELMKLMLPTIRADFKLCESYVYLPEPPLDYRISAYGGLQDQSVTREGLEAWREQTNTSFSLSMLKGDHFFLHLYRDVLLRDLSKELSALIT